MNDYLRISLCATLTVILLCLVDSGFCYPVEDEYQVGYKRDAPIKTAIRSSKNWGRNELDNFLQGKTRDRNYLTGLLQKRQGQISSLVPIFQTLRHWQDDAGPVDPNIVLTNKALMDIAGKRR